MSPMIRAGVVTCAVALVVAACNSDGILTSRNLSHSVVTNACGPADGPAVSFKFANRPISTQNPGTPLIIVMIEGELLPLEGRTIALAGPAAGGGATYVPKPDTYESPTAGSITIANISADSTVTGSIQLTFPSLSVATPFVAPFRLTQMNCV